MRRLVGWTAGLVGIAALARLLSRRRSHPAPQPSLPPSAPVPEQDPAAELRRKLSETREPAGDGTPDGDEPQERKESVEARRARVHAKAQEAIEAMQEPLE